MTFNGEQVSGSPFLCRVTDDGDDDEEEILDGIAPPDFASTALDGDDGKGLRWGEGQSKANGIWEVAWILYYCASSQSCTYLIDGHNV